MKYLTGYLIEKSLSVDNIFVIAMIFAFLAVPPIYQHRVLFWGILGALVMRGVMIWLGAGLIHKYTWVIYVFGGFLILTGDQDAAHQGRAGPVEERRGPRSPSGCSPSPTSFTASTSSSAPAPTRRTRAAVPGAELEHDPAVARMERAEAGALMMTPLFLALILVEFTDLIFAVDSIPAIFAITTDPFLVFTSNVFAILGLRSLYFALAGMIDKFRYLKVSLAAVLVLVGVKMMTHVQLKAWLGEHFNLYLLAAVLLILAAGVVASLIANRRDRRKGEAHVAEDSEPAASISSFSSDR